MNYYKLPVKRNFGTITEVSKSINEFFGDNSGRTVSLRTAHGLKNLFKAHEMGEDTAEDIVHAGMIATGTMLRSKDENTKATGAFLSLVLFCCYQAGK